MTHPLTPPPELVKQWANAWHTGTCTQELLEYIATQAARWGADQELEACCEWLRSKDVLEPAIDALRAARRPKPPSLKQQALSELDSLENMGACNADTIRRALESLPD